MGSGEILWRLGLDVGWEKVVCWSTKAAISLKRVEIEEKLLWRTYRKSTTLFRPVPSPTPYVFPSPRLGFATPTQNCNRYYLRKGKVTNFKFGWYIQRVHLNKSPLKCLEKRERGICRDCPILKVPPVISGTGKTTTSSLADTFAGSIRTKAHYKFWTKKSVDFPGTVQIF